MTAHERFVPIEGEEWKEVIGFEKYYKVSTLGRIRSVSNRASCPLKFTPDRMVKPYNHKGYLRVILIVKGVKRYFKVHRLVCSAFIPNPENKPEINHKDFNKQNNKLSNLEWCTGKENYIHAIRGGRNLPPRQKQYKISYMPPSGKDAPDSKIFYQYSLEGYFIQELKGISFHSRKISGNSRGLQKSISRGYAFYGYMYSLEKKDCIST